MRRTSARLWRATLQPTCNDSIYDMGNDKKLSTAILPSFCDHQRNAYGLSIGAHFKSSSLQRDSFRPPESTPCRVFSAECCGRRELPHCRHGLHTLCEMMYSQLLPLQLFPYQTIASHWCVEIPCLVKFLPHTGDPKMICTYCER